AGRERCWKTSGAIGGNRTLVVLRDRYRPAEGTRSSSPPLTREASEMNATPDKIHKVIQLGVIAAYAAAVEWIAFRAGKPADPWWWTVNIPFSLWIVAPIAVPLLLR